MHPSRRASSRGASSRGGLANVCRAGTAQTVLAPRQGPGGAQAQTGSAAGWVAQGNCAQRSAERLRPSSTMAMRTSVDSGKGEACGMWRWCDGGVAWALNTRLWCMRLPCRPCLSKTPAYPATVTGNQMAHLLVGRDTKDCSPPPCRWHHPVRWRIRRCADGGIVEMEPSCVVAPMREHLRGAPLEGAAAGRT